MIKAVFFDFDGVLTTDFNGTGTICENLHQYCSAVSLADLHEIYLRHALPLFKSGQPHETIWPAFCEEIGQTISFDALHRALATFPKNDAMFALAQELKQQCTVGMITDNFADRMDLIEEKEQLSTIFDPIVVSSKVGVSKHDGTPRIFQIALEQAACAPEEAVFIDNQEKNLVVPVQMGIHTYWFDNAKNDVAALRVALAEWGLEIHL